MRWSIAQRVPWAPSTGYRPPWTGQYRANAPETASFWELEAGRWPGRVDCWPGPRRAPGDILRGPRRFILSASADQSQDRAAFPAVRPPIVRAEVCPVVAIHRPVSGIISLRQLTNGATTMRQRPDDPRLAYLNRLRKSLGLRPLRKSPKDVDTHRLQLERQVREAVE